MKKRIYLDLLIIFVLGLIPLLWFHDNQVILGHDAGLSLSPTMHFLDRLYIWSQRFGIGTDQSYALLGAFFIHGFEAFLSFIGLSLQLQQKIQFIFWFTLPGLSMYFFVHKIWPEKKYMAIVAPLIYMVNYYLIQAWFVAERTKFSIYIALPLVMYFMIAYLTRKMSLLPSILLTGLTLGIFNGGGSFPLYGGLIFAIMVSYVYINLIYLNKETLKRTILFSLGVSIMYALLNSYWLISYYYYVLSFYGRDLANAGGANGVLTWVAYLSKGSNLLNLLRGQGIPEWYLNDFHPYAGTLLKNPIFQIASFAFTFLAIFPLVVAKVKKDKFYIYLLIFLALVGIFLSAGTNSQFGFLFEALVRYVPGFPMFRSAYYKFDYIEWFSYAILIGFALDYLTEKIVERRPRVSIFNTGSLLLVIFIFAYLFYHFPILNGSFFDYSSNPQSKQTTRVTVPQYVFDFGTWANKQDPNRRFLVIPELNDSTYVSYQWGYWSIAPLSSLLTRNSFVQNTALIPESERFLMKQMYDRLLTQDLDSFMDFADLFAIDSIIVQKDYNWKSGLWPTTDPAVYDKILSSSPRFRLDREFGEWKVYKIVGREKSLRISASNSLNFLQGELGNVVSFPFFNPKIPLYMGDSNPTTNSFFTSAATSIFLGANCIECDLKEKAKGFELYNPKILPGSRLYDLLVTRSEDKIKQKSNDFGSKVNFYLTTSDRRSIEARWMVEFRQNMQELQHTLERQRDSLSNLKQELKNPNWGMDEEEADLLAKKITGHLDSQAELISFIHNDAQLTLDHRLAIASSYELITQIEQMIKGRQWVTQDAYNKKYELKFPVLGKYDLYIKKGSLANPGKDISQSTLNIRELGVTLKPLNMVKDWIYYGSLDIPTNVLHVSYLDSTVENLLSGEPIYATNSGIIKLPNSYVLTGQSENKCINFPVHNLAGGNTKYIVSFTYRNFTDKKSLSFNVDDSPRDNSSLRTKETFLPSKPQWTTFMTPLTPKKSDLVIDLCNGFTPTSQLNATATYLSFLATNYDGTVSPSGIQDQSLDGKVSEIRDVAIYKVSEPSVIFYKKNNSTDEINTEIDFNKKSPVEYEVRLSPTNRPTFITMKESYGKFWRACEGSKCLPFDDKVHFADAGFANTWYFENGISSKLNFYYYPQKTFVLGSIVSVISYLSVIGVLFYLNKRRKNV